MSLKENLEQSIKDNLFELFAKDFQRARNPEIYTALANSIRQLVGKKWFHSLYDDLKAKRLYILSFEYTIGDNLLKNLVKLGLFDVCKEILADHDIKIEDIMDLDLEFALGFGDLGAVSGYLLEYLSKHHKNVYAYGLRYRNGMLRQEIVDGEQVEKPDSWRVNNNPWEHEKGFHHKVEFKNDAVKAIPYDIPIMANDADNVSTLRLWKSFSTEDLDFEKFSKGMIHESYRHINRANSIVEFLYPSEDNYEGKKLRLEQEYFFASASIQDILKKYKKYVGEDISDLNKYIVIQLNDVHPAMSILVFIEQLIKKYDFTFSQALSMAEKVFIYMQLSLLPETMEKWDLSLIAEVCPQLVDIIYQLDEHIRSRLVEERGQNPSELLVIKESKVDMVNILYGVSKHIVSITNNHKNLLKERFLHYQYNHYKDKFVYIDLDFDTLQYYRERQVRQISGIDLFGNVTSKDLEVIKSDNKVELLNNINLDSRLFNPESCFVMHLGNFHEYKRQLLSALSIALQYMRMRRNPNKDIAERTYFFSGKSYPNYYLAKETIKFINALAQLVNNDLFIRDKLKIVFIENFDLSKSNLAIPASDIYLDLELLSMESNNISLTKAIASGSSILASASSYENSKFNNADIHIYQFGESIEDVIYNFSYNMKHYIDVNQEIKDLFSYFRNLSDHEFPYDIDKLYNHILHYNDRNHIIKDLLEYTDKLESIIKEYSRVNGWYDRLYDNIKKINNKDLTVSKYLGILE